MKNRKMTKEWKFINIRALEEEREAQEENEEVERRKYLMQLNGEKNNKKGKG